MLLLPRFDYHEPTDIPGALEMLSSLNGDAKIIAGGTDLLVNMKKGTQRPKHVVSLSRLPGLSGIGKEGDATVIGSHTTIAQLAKRGSLQPPLTGVAQGASVLGSPLIRNRATIGGNIVTARPAADMPPSLIALAARVRLMSLRGTREVDLDQFFTGPGQTMIANDEVLTAVVIDQPPPNTGCGYTKLGHRNALEIAIVAVAARITLDDGKKVITDARVVLSAVAPTVIHAPSAEALLAGKKPGSELFAEAGRLASGDCRPITDIRGGDTYRCAMVEVLTKRSLEAAFAHALGQ